MAKLFGIYFGEERKHQKMAQKLYNHIIMQSREKTLYGAEGAPDTANGRFELIILHIFLVFRQLDDKDALVHSVKQKCFDQFWVDMDMNLREIGVGPDGVPKRIQKMLENFYGRAAAYQEALTEHEDNAEEQFAALKETIARNVFYDDKMNELGARKLTEYTLDALKNLEAYAQNDLIEANFSFQS